MRELLIATRSKGKFPEIVLVLSGTPFECINLNDTDLPKDFEVAETGTTFEGNAIIKAMTIGRKTGKLTLADDSGLEIDALDGRPGVYSARYAPGSDVDRYQKVLGEMEGVPDEKRAARFHSVIAIYDPEIDDRVRVSHGVCEGRILREPKGEHGFGYDPIFFADDLGKTFAEVELEGKTHISHRGKALVKAKEILFKEFV